MMQEELQFDEAILADTPCMAYAGFYADIYALDRALRREPQRKPEIDAARTKMNTSWQKFKEQPKKMRTAWGNKESSA